MHIINEILTYLLLFLACQTAVHKKCYDKLLGTCSESSFNSESTIVSSRVGTMGIRIQN